MIVPPFAAMFVFIILVHVLIMMYAWVEKRFKPVLAKLNLFQSETEILHTIAAEYLDLGIAVPGHCIVSPQSVIVVEAKRIETRLVIEFFAVGLAGFIPPGLIALLINMLH